jgi:hypothetical protein
MHAHEGEEAAGWSGSPPRPRRPFYYRHTRMLNRRKGKYSSVDGAYNMHLVFCLIIAAVG